MPFGGPTKKIVNAHIGHEVIPICAIRECQNVLVLDTAELGSAKAFLKAGISRENIFVFGNDPGLKKAAKKFGVHCEPGISTDVLEKLKNVKFCVIYLDYCGTPSGNASFSPKEDISRASAMLIRGGAIYCTFSKRTTNHLQKVMQLCPPNHHMGRVFEYKDPAPMLLVAYSSRPLPRVGPPIGTIVEVPKPTGGHWHGLVEKILVNNECKLSEVKKKRNKWVKTKVNENWVEPFGIMRIVTLPNPKKKKPVKKKRVVNTAVPASAAVSVSAAIETPVTQVSAFFDELITMEPRFKVPLINAKKKCQEHYIEKLFTLKKLPEDSWNQLILNIGVREYVREYIGYMGAAMVETRAAVSITPKKKKKNQKNIPEAIGLFKQFVDECVETTPKPGSCFVLKGAMWKLYNSYMDAKEVPKTMRLSDRCSRECKALKCPVNNCPRFLVHMCDVLGHEHYVEKKGLYVRETRKNSGPKGSNYYYKAHLRRSKCECLSSNASQFITSANYKNVS